LSPKLEDGNPNKLHDKIIAQVEEEYQQAKNSLEPRMRENVARLRLYNNQRRDKTKVGEPTLFELLQTIMAATYYDKLQSEAEAREEGDVEAAAAYNGVMDFDYDEMRKAEVDHDWNFDALAFGRGILYFNEFDLKSKTPIPEVWDAITFLRDPRATSVNGNRLKHGALRFGGREVFLSMSEMKDNPEYFNVKGLRRGRSELGSITAEAERLKRDAHGITTFPDDLEGENAEYQTLQWFTHLAGRKVFLELANNRKKLIRITPIDGEWPLIDRPAYPMSHDWDGVSIFDIAEDKQRFKAELLNLAGASAKADLYPMYLFDSTRIDKQRDLTFGFQKIIPIQGNTEGVMTPLRKSQPSNQFQWVLDYLDLSAQKALATPEMQMGVPGKANRTLGEQQLVAGKVDTRYALPDRIWGWSEWRSWKRH